MFILLLIHFVWKAKQQKDFDQIGSFNQILFVWLWVDPPSSVEHIKDFIAVFLFDGEIGECIKLYFESILN